jgi:hypothetical protein
MCARVLARDGDDGRRHLPLGRAFECRKQPLRFELRQAEALHELRACAGRGVDEVAHGVRLRPRAEEVGRSTPSTLKYSEYPLVLPSKQWPSLFTARPNV